MRFLLDHDVDAAVGQTLRLRVAIMASLRLAITILRLCGAPSIAAALRYHARLGLPGHSGPS